MSQQRKQHLNIIEKVEKFKFSSNQELQVKLLHRCYFSFFYFSATLTQIEIGEKSECSFPYELEFYTVFIFFPELLKLLFLTHN